MIGKSFWQEVLRDGAILGLVMAASHLFESFMLFGDMSLSSMSLVVTIEMLVAAIFFVWYLYRSAKRCSLEADPQIGFPYSTGLLYVFVMSVLSGVLVGLSHIIYINAIGGYGAYVDAVVVRFEQMAELMPVDNSALFDQMIDQLTASEKPTAMQAIVSSVNNYIISGGFMGLIIAGVVRREPKRDNFTE